MLPANKLELVERVVARRVKERLLIREPSEAEWAEAWQLIKARPEMPEELLADTAFSALRPPTESLAFTDRARMLAVQTVMPPATMKTCGGCGKPIATNATACPHCGKRHSTPATIAAAILIGLVLAYGSCVFVVPR